MPEGDDSATTSWTPTDIASTESRLRSAATLQMGSPSIAAVISCVDTPRTRSDSATASRSSPVPAMTTIVLIAESLNAS